MENIKFWNVIDKDNKQIAPRIYSNGKSQEDVIKEIILNFKRNPPKDEKPSITILEGGAGSGKSLIALNIARVFGSALIVVPRINLQHQYEQDYSSNDAKFFIPKKDGSNLKIALLKGRGNFDCKYSPLYKANDDEIPCKEQTINGRKNIAMSCPFWSPVSMEEDYIKDQSVSEIKEYESISGERYQFVRNNQCKYYKQFTDCIDSDTIILNQSMLQVELFLGRLPRRKILIIDEFDYFLDSLRNNMIINFNFFQKMIKKDFKNNISNALGKTKYDYFIELMEDIKNDIIQKNFNTYHKVKDNLLLQELLKILGKPKLKDIYGFKNLHNSVVTFSMLPSSIYYFLERNNKNNIIITFFILDLSNMVRNIFSNFDHILGMSATIQNSGVLNQIYGITSNMYGNKIIKSEEQILGTLKLSEKLPASKLLKCNYQTLQNNRRKFHDLLDKCVEISKGKQTLVHITSFTDFPSEKRDLLLDNIPYIEEIREEMKADTGGKRLHNFKNGKSQILYSTTDIRGTDLPDEMCRYIIFPKYPFPNVNEPYYITLKNFNESLFWKFYFDVANRQLLQGVCRGLRHKKDYLTILSPDIRIHNKVKQLIMKR